MWGGEGVEGGGGGGRGGGRRKRGGGGCMSVGGGGGGLCGRGPGLPGVGREQLPSQCPEDQSLNENREKQHLS